MSKKKNSNEFSKKEKRGEASAGLSKEARLHISKKIAKIMHEGGRSQEQAVAIAYSIQDRKKKEKK